jgi:ribonuclease P protein subunit POP4
MRTITNITKHEFVGTELQVAEAVNQDLIGIGGVVVDETRNTFIIQTPKGERQVLKNGAQFKTTIQNQEVLIEGHILVAKPEDRLKK